MKSTPPKSHPCWWLGPPDFVTFRAEPLYGKPWCPWGCGFAAWSPHWKMCCRKIQLTCSLGAKILRKCSWNEIGVLYLLMLHLGACIAYIYLYPESDWMDIYIYVSISDHIDFPQPISILCNNFDDLPTNRTNFRIEKNPGLSEMLTHMLGSRAIRSCSLFLIQASSELLGVTFLKYPLVNIQKTIENCHL